MSYTKLNKEIEKYYKVKNIPFHYNASTITKEEQAENLKFYNLIRDLVTRKWIDEKRYKELISCAHGRWFPYNEFIKPLAEYFIKENLILHLKFLNEREIRSKVEATIKCLKIVEENYPNLTKAEIIAYDLTKIIEEKKYHPIMELLRWR